MKLSELAVQPLIAALDRLKAREEAESDFLNQKDFPDCRSRMQAWIDMAIEEARPLMSIEPGYVATLHREKEHGDDTMEEQSALLKAGADPEIGTISWWNQ